MEVAEGLHAVQLIGSNSFVILDDGITLIDAGHRGSIRPLRGT